jgi:hypothetical protein
VGLFHWDSRAPRCFVTILNVHLYLQISAAQNDYTFAALRSFSGFSTNILNIGIAGLEGCTVLTVVSPTAVYMVSSSHRNRNRNYETFSNSQGSRGTSMRTWHSPQTAAPTQPLPSSRTASTSSRAKARHGEQEGTVSIQVYSREATAQPSPSS